MGGRCEVSTDAQGVSIDCGFWYLPGNANRLWHLKCGDESLQVHWVDLVDTQSGTNENEGWMEKSTVGVGDCHEAILVYVGEVARGINP